MSKKRKRLPPDVLDLFNSQLDPHTLDWIESQCRIQHEIIRLRKNCRLKLNFDDIKVVDVEAVDIRFNDPADPPLTIEYQTFSRIYKISGNKNARKLRVSGLKRHIVGDLNSAEHNYQKQLD